jgi:hypothetical protein
VTSLTVMGLLQKGALVPIERQRQSWSARNCWPPATGGCAVARHADGDDLSGADDGAQPGGARSAARSTRCCASIPISDARARRQKDSGDDGACPAARRGADLFILPAPAVGRTAPAHHDRDGAGARAQIADRGRADHRARRHHARSRS